MNTRHYPSLAQAQWQSAYKRSWKEFARDETDSPFHKLQRVQLIVLAASGNEFLKGRYRHAVGFRDAWQLIETAKGEILWGS